MELMHANQPNSNDQSGMSAQKYIDVEEIKNDIVVLKNKSLRAVLLVSSINFDLKSLEEQEELSVDIKTF